MKIEFNVEKLPSGTYRVRKQINGKRVSILFDHDPKQSEIMKEISKRTDEIPKKGSFQSCAESYISSKDKVISPSTIKGYTSILNALPKDFTRMELSKITQIDIQKVINDYAVDHSPKSVRNIHGFISAVLRQFRPDMNIYTTLPQKREYEHYTPSEEDIKRILEETKDNPFYHIPFQLGIMGLRRSEICALTIDDVDFENNMLTINKAMVKDVKNNWVIKSTKTTAGTRMIYIPDTLLAEIKEYGKIYDGEPTTLLYGLNRIQKKLGIQRFRFHDLRVFFCSYCHYKGMSDENIMATGGWKSSFTMKNVYRHEMKAVEDQKAIFGALIN